MCNLRVGTKPAPSAIQHLPTRTDFQVRQEDVPISPDSEIENVFRDLDRDQKIKI